jgi:hypothetical protein
MRLPINFGLQSDHASKTSYFMAVTVLGLSVAAAMISPVSISPASAFVGAAGSALPQQFKQHSAQDNQIIQVDVRRGGAIAAGAAIGVVTSATAAAWAGAPPGPGYCWYYTDPSRTLGFWDVCQ